jgi:uncharacterized protein
MVANLILSGGVAHDYARTSAMLAEVLAGVGVESDVREDLAVTESGGLLAYDLLTLNCARWTCDQTPEWRDDWRSELPQAAREGIVEFLSRGGGLLALHCATICFDDWPEYREVLGAWWEWGHSGHAPLQEQPMRIVGTHPIVAGMADFAIVDELYTNARTCGDLAPLVLAEWEGVTHPILWVREYGRARVCYNALGHGPEAFANPSNRLLLQRGALWAARRDA